MQFWLVVLIWDWLFFSGDILNSLNLLINWDAENLLQLIIIC